MRSKGRRNCLGWRPPGSEWRSSTLSPHDNDLKQRWHRRYGRLGRRYETQTPNGPSVVEHYGPWEREYRDRLRRDIAALSGPRGLANRADPAERRQSIPNQVTSSEDRVYSVEDFLSKLTGHDQPRNDAESASDKMTDATPDEADEPMERRYTALEKGKQREGTPAPSSARGPSALKPPSASSSQLQDSRMSSQGLRSLRKLPHSRPPSDKKGETGPSVQHVEHAASKSSEMTRSLSRARGAAASSISAADRLAQARVAYGYAAELPSDGLGVIHEHPSPPERALATWRYLLPARQRTQSQVGVTGPNPESHAALEQPQSWDGDPGPSSQTYADAVAKSNRRLDELSPYSPEVTIPDTPMPILNTKLPKSPPLHLSESVDSSDEHLPSRNNSKQYQVPICRTKRNASEISGGQDAGGPSKRQPHLLRPLGAQSTAVATLSIDGHNRRIT